MSTQAPVGPNLGNSGPLIEMTINGREIKAKYIGQHEKARLEQALIQRARQELGKEKDFMSDAEYGIAYSTFHDKVITGQYAFGSRLSQQWMSTVPGLSALLAVCTGVPSDEWAELTLSHSLECGTLIKMIMESSFPNLKEEEPS